MFNIYRWLKIHENPDFGVRNIHKSGEVSHPLPTRSWNAAPARLPRGSTISRLRGWWVRPPSPTIWRWKLVIFGVHQQQGYHWDIENGDIMEYIYIELCMYVCMCVYIYIYVAPFFIKRMYVYIYILCIYIYTIIYIIIYITIYVWMCMSATFYMIWSLEIG